MAQPVSAAKNSYPAAALTAATAAKAAAFGREADENTNTLVEYRFVKRYQAKNGEKGHGSDRYGAGADDIVLKMPVGTLIRDLDTDEIVADLTYHGQRVCLAKGGKGGLGKHPLQILRQPCAQTIHARRKKVKPVPCNSSLKVLRRRRLLGMPNAGNPP